MSLKNFFKKYSKTQIKKAGKVTTFICGVLGIIIGYWGGINAISAITAVSSFTLLMGIIKMLYTSDKNITRLIVYTFLYVVIVTMSAAGITAILVNFGFNINTIFPITMAPIIFIVSSWMALLGCLNHIQTKD